MNDNEKKHASEMFENLSNILKKNASNDVILKHNKANVQLCKDVTRYDGMDEEWDESDIHFVSKKKFRAPFPDWELAAYFQQKVLE